MGKMILGRKSLVLFEIKEINLNHPVLIHVHKGLFIELICLATMTSLRDNVMSLRCMIRRRSVIHRIPITFLFGKKTTG